MKTIIAGSRNINNLELVEKAVAASGFEISEVVSGAARGVDRLGEQWAENNALPTKRFQADWRRYGRGAGYVRNREMADYADALIAIWNGESPGTNHMIDEAKKRSLRIYVHRID